MKQKGMLGFTVIEFLIVIGIIFVLAGALLPALSKSRQMAKKRNAQEVIHQLEIALRMYGEDYGTYPAGTGSDCINLMRCLQKEVGNGPYCEWSVEDGDNLDDPWGKPYRYDDAAPSEGAGISYKIWSIGADGNNDSGSGDDITNW